jgi:cardiolipin synthase A/B
MALPQLHDGHTVQLLQGGQAFFPALVRAIDAARFEVRFETYIFNLDASGQTVAEALARAAERKVAVTLMMDGAGTPSLPPEWGARFDAAGVKWHIFSPLGRIGWFIPSRWRRLHRKLCVVDGHTAFCGGINVLDDFYDPNHGALESPRFDFSVQVTGPLVRAVAETTAQFWWRSRAAKEARERDFPQAWAALQSAVRLGVQSNRDEDTGNSEPAANPGGPARTDALQHTARAALVLRDNVRQRTQIERAYRKAIGEARSEIIIANAYFMPGARLRHGLIHAARRGVRVRLLLQGRYEYFMQYHAARPVFGALLAAGVEIHEYAPSFLHAKVAVIDSHWATVGSSNLDPLSLLLAREANVVITDSAFAQDLRQRLEHAMQHQGTRMDPEVYANRPLRQRFLDRLAFGVMRLLLFLNGSSY